MVHGNLETDIVEKIIEALEYGYERLVCENKLYEFEPLIAHCRPSL